MIKAGMTRAHGASRAVCWSGLGVGLGVVCSIVLGCGGPPRPETSGAIYRFVESPPQDIFEIRDIAVESAVLDLTPDPALKNGGWKLGEVAKSRGWKDGRLHLRLSGEGDAALTRTIVRRVAGIDVI